MMKRPHLVPAMLALATLAACSQQAPAPSGGPDGNVAVVDGRAITRAAFAEYVDGLTKKKVEDLKPEEREELVTNLIRATLVVAEAERNGLTKRPEIQARLELERLGTLHQAVSDEFRKANAATDAELQAEYDAQIAKMDKTRYRASHILVATEDEAKSIISQLQRGASFAQLAGRLSRDNGSKDKGGDLDWFTITSMTPAFANAVKDLKKGETTPVPVQSEFGWHVIRLTDTGENPVPAFDAVKDRVRQIVESNKFKAHGDALMAAAKITKTP